MTVSIAAVLVFLFMDFGVASDEQLFITPSPSDPCPTDNCLTFDQFAANSTDYLGTNTTLHFMEGNHTLELGFSIKKADVFSMQSNSSNVAIICNSNSSARMRFVRIGTLHIKGLTFIGCSRNKMKTIDHFILEDSSFIGDSDNTTESGTPLELVETSATFTRSKFSFNSGTKVRSLQCKYYYSRSYHRREHLYDLDGVYLWGDNIRARVGGAILATWSNVTIVNSTFKGNNAQAGGVIFAELQSNITILNSHFLENQATFIRSGYDCYYGGGGVLYVDSSNTSTVTVKTSSFERNTGEWLGGVIALASTTDHVIINITDSDFVSNEAQKRGGVLDLSSANNVSVAIFGSTFHNNSAKFGGTVNVLGSKATLIDISSSTFTNNSALQEAGVLDSSHNINTTITITDSKFIGNHVRDDRAGVVDVTYSINVTVNILHSEFIGNKAQGGGGVMDVSYAKGMTTINISDSTFEYNIAKLYDGGAVNFWDSSNLIVVIKASNFSNNTANGGGAIGANLVANVSLTISESNFIENYARQGGALFCVSRHNLSRIVITRSIFQKNSVAYSGGVLRTRNFEVQIVTSEFLNNSASNGGTVSISGGKIVMRESQFYNNRAMYGGLLCAQDSTVNVYTTVSRENLAEKDGGLFHIQLTNTTIIEANFNHNRADNNGGIMYTTGGTTIINNTKMDQNSAGNDGGVIRSYMSGVNIYDSRVTSNRAENSGGVFCTEQSNLTIGRTSFVRNKASAGGVLQAEQGISTINQSLFLNNTAHTGGVMHINNQATVKSHGSNMTENYALISIVYLSDSIAVFSKLDFSYNVGTLLAFGSSLTIGDGSNLTSNIQPTQWTNVRKFQEGGAITAFLSDVIFNGKCHLNNNEAEDGGAIKALESKVQVYGSVTVENNRASKTGGGIYLYFSELTSWKNSVLNFIRNSAVNRGGGIYATDSSIKVKDSSSKERSTVHFVENTAEKGGGLYIKKDSKLYIIKSRPDIHNKIVTFTSNSAEFGGAIYASNDGMCSLSKNSTRKECFFQTLAMYSTMRTRPQSQCRNIYFINNTAEMSGHSLFGGLLDRCRVNLFAESNVDIVNKHHIRSNDGLVVRGYEYFKKISNVQDSDISSYPVRVCFCKDGKPDCTYQPDPNHITKGKGNKLMLSVAVVDQINRPIKEAALYSHLGSGNDVCQNHIQHTEGICRGLSFAVFSNNDTEDLILSLGKGPCKRSRESKARITLEFSCLQCPIGFELDESRGGCRCACDSQLFPFFTECLGDIIIRERNVWVTNITNMNGTTNSSINQFLIHPFCPLNYCQPPSSRVEINLNIPGGANVQCADNRSGLLCGTCRPGLSLSLGSSRCLTCSTHWLAILLVILIAAFIAGMLLVAVLLVLNLTVAVGTLNGIIFYANIVAANASIYLPFSYPSFITVFISWLNLEIGFDTCFFDGMDAYWKTLIQLIFPVYIIILVVVVIIICETSSRFAKLIGKRNPVATLATLILLCYAKLLHTVIASLSFTVLRYPDGSQQTVWLPDATVAYLKGKHIVLFVIAVLILIVGIVYTAILLSWQWLLRLQNIKVFKWMSYQKLCHFIEPYHAPYAFKYRYWTGLLLLIRVVLYMVSAINVEGDPRVTLVANLFVIGSLLLMKGVFEKWIYKKWPIDILETIMYFNILAFSAFTWYTLDSGKSQAAVAYTSIMITFFLLLSVISFHVYKYTAFGSIIRQNPALKWILAKFQAKTVQDNPKSEEEPTQPTFSVVEVHQLQHIRQPSADEEDVTY